MNYLILNKKIEIKLNYNMNKFWWMSDEKKWKMKNEMLGKIYI